VAEGDQEDVRLGPLETHEDLSIVHLFERGAGRLVHVQVEIRMGSQEPVGCGGHRSLFPAEEENP
jgi:hypothetical protein